MVGAGGFEPPNTGSKVPRLTAWPRPSRAHEANYKTLSVADLPFTGNPSHDPFGDRLRPALVLGAGQGAGHDGLRAVTGQRLSGALGGGAPAVQTEHGRAAPRHRGGRGPEIAKLLLERTDFLMTPHHRRLQVVDHLGGARGPR